MGGFVVRDRRVRHTSSSISTASRAVTRASSTPEVAGPVPERREQRRIECRSSSLGAERQDLLVQSSPPGSVEMSGHFVQQQ